MLKTALLLKVLIIVSFNPFMHNVVKWPNILLKSCGVHTAILIKYVWLFYNIMYERVKHLFAFRVYTRSTVKTLLDIYDGDFVRHL